MGERGTQNPLIRILCPRGVMTIWKVPSYIKLKPSSICWFCFILLGTKFLVRLGSAEQNGCSWSQYAGVRQCGGWDMEGKNKGTLDSTGTSKEKLRECLPELWIQGMGSCGTHSLTSHPVGWGWLHGPRAPEASRKQMTQESLRRKMLFSSAVAGIRHGPRACDMGHQKYLPRDQKWHLCQGRAQI